MSVAKVNRLLSKAALYSNSFRYSARTTVDNREVEFFGKLSSEWWDEEGGLKALHTMNRIRIPFICDGLISTGVVKKEFAETSQPLKNLRILEAGCGAGVLSESIARCGCDVIGLDPSKELIAVAQHHASKDKSLNNLKYVPSTIEDFSPDNLQAFDAVVSSEVLEHVHDVEKFVTECAKCVKPGGSIFFTTINRTPLSRVVMLFLAEDVFRVIPRGTHEYEKFVKPSFVRKVLDENNCSVKVVRGFMFNVFNTTWRWINTTSLSYAMHAVKNGRK